MKKSVNLLEGSIFPSLTKLALPIMATSLVQMAYNMTDMIWIGRISSDAVAAVGAAGMYMWLANGLATLAKMGGQVKVAHAIGAKDYEEATVFTKSALQLGILFGIIYGLAAVLFAGPLISFFHLNSPQVVADARIYLQVTCGGVIFSFLNQIFTGIMTAMGNSRISFMATAVGLLINIVLDPLLIFGAGPIPKMGVLGAAVATVLAQTVVTAMFLWAAFHEETVFQKVRILSGIHREHMMLLIKIGLPSAVQSMIFTGISMIIARLIAGFGDSAVAVQKVGSQIESISWMTAEGFAAAVNSFVAQNYGADNIKRVKKGYRIAMGVVTVWGIFCTILLIGCPEVIFRIFIPDDKILPMGVDYLRILGYSQLFMCAEITTGGAFAGIGKTLPPSIVSVILTTARIPMAMLLTATALGLNGIWWSITISSILKGICLLVGFLIYMKRLKPRKMLLGSQ